MDILYCTQKNLLTLEEVENTQTFLFEKINDIRFRKADAIKKKSFLVALILFGFMAIDLICLMNSRINHAKAQGYFLGTTEAIISFFIEIFILVIIFVLILYVVKRVIYYIASKCDLSEEENIIINNFKIDINKLDLKREELINDLNKSLIPRDYRNLSAINFMIRAYENKQGDELKELVNLYESHIIANEIKLEIQRKNNLHENEINKIKKDIKKVKRDLENNSNSIEYLKIRNLFK